MQKATLRQPDSTRLGVVNGGADAPPFFRLIRTAAPVMNAAIVGN